MTPGLLDGLFASGPDDETVAEFETQLEGYYQADEQVQYRLPGSGGLVHESGGESRTVGEGNGLLAVVTDHRVLFATRKGGVSVLELPYTAIRGVSLDDGLFRTVLAVEHWEEGEYQFRPTTGGVADAVAYIERARDCWGFVETLVEEFEGHLTSIEADSEAGRFDRVETTVTQARDTVEKLDRRVRAADMEHVLGDRVTAARQQLARTRVDVRLARARSLVAEAEAGHLERTDIDYIEVYERYSAARDQLSTAADIAEEHGLEADGLAEVHDQIDERLDLLARQPVRLAEQATERALGADDAARRVEAMQAALGHARDALSVGWGTDIDSPHDHEALRFRVALLADGLVDARREYAAQMETAGDRLAEEGDNEAARERYRAAVEQLDAALECAREFRAPDPGPVERERDRLERTIREPATVG